MPVQHLPHSKVPTSHPDPRANHYTTAPQPEHYRYETNIPYPSGSSRRTLYLV